MILLSFIAAVVLYTIMVSLLYTSFKNSSLYYPAGLLLALLANALWLYIAKQSNEHNLYIRGLIWDSIIVGAYSLLPILFFGVRLTPQISIGCGLIILGFIIIKL